MKTRKIILGQKKEIRDREIYEKYFRGKSAPQLGFEYGLSRTSILRIVREMEKEKNG